MKHLLTAALTLSVAALSAAGESYTCDPSLSTVIDAGARQVYYLVLSDDAVATLRQSDISVTYVGPDANSGRNLWYWNGFTAGDVSMPRVDFDEGEYISVNVTGEGGWSGAGINISADYPMNLSTFNDDTHFHLAYMTPTDNAPSSVGMILLDSGKFALGNAYDDNGTTYPSIAPKATNEWQAIDITLGQLKQIFPGFSPANLVNWSGNIMSWLAGGVAGTTIAFDAVYFYNTTDVEQSEVPVYTCDPTTSRVANSGVTTVNHLILSNGAIAELQQAGATCTYIGPDANSGRNLYYWNGLTAGDTSTPRVDQEEGEYISVNINGEGGWSGAGINIADTNPVDLSNITDDTHFHLAYMSPTTAPSSVALVIMEGAKIALGTAYDDNGTTYPSVAPTATSEWQGIDITIAQLKDLCPSFAPTNLSSWNGNIFSWLAGGVANTSIAFDAVYFYNADASGVATVKAETSQFVVTGNTINVTGCNGIELYNLAGQMVKRTNGCTLDINGLNAGIYVAKTQNAVKKVVIK
jgi:hypothetical protein